MRALQLFGDRDLRLTEIEEPAAPGPGEVLLAPRVVALNHIDVWGFRGMAFAQRRLPLVVGAEGVAEVVAVGPDVVGLSPGQLVAPYGALVCGECAYCQAGCNNLCENVRGVLGFHVDGLARERMVWPARLLVPVPEGVDVQDAACATVTLGTVQHMLFDNAKLLPGETILVQAAGSGIGSVAIRVAKSLGCKVFTTVGGEAKMEQARALGADVVIDYTKDRFESIVRRQTGKKGVDVVFEHVGTTTWEGSLFCLKPGGRLVTCGSTSGMTAQINLMQLFQRQQRIFGSFGCTIANVGEALGWMARGVRPVIDTVVPMEDFTRGLERLETRRVFGKVLVTI
jgi:NADPH:quinone reductase-like Zn-dependent oxidoreductase